MTNEEQRVAIAQVCNWIVTGDDVDGALPYMTQKGVFIGDPLKDLNAMREAEKVLTNEQQRRYADQLVQVHPLRYDPRTPGPLCHDGGSMNLFLIASMTAAQRAEAFLRTLNLWKDQNHVPPSQSS